MTVMRDPTVIYEYQVVYQWPFSLGATLTELGTEGWEPILFTVNGAVRPATEDKDEGYDVKVAAAIVRRPVQGKS